MRAVIYSKTGNASDVLSIQDRPVPEPGPGEVRVKVGYSGVNPTDWKARAGATSGAALTIDAVGPGVTGVTVGDRVWLWLSAYQRPTGTAAEYAVVPARQAVPLGEASFQVGASLGVPAMTAHRALTVRDGGPRRLEAGALAGQTVLVAGGAGAVGHAAIQLATWAGATVITTVSSDAKATLARAAGAEHVVDYKHTDAAKAIREIAPGGVDIIVEVSPGNNAELDAAVIAPHGTISVYANDGGDTMTIPIRAHMGPNTRYQFVLVYTMGDQAQDDAVAAVREAVSHGVLPVGAEAGLPLTVFDLDQTADAHDAVEAGTIGKVLILVKGE
jgi:NADPH2:quinone reductase